MAPPAAIATPATPLRELARLLARSGTGWIAVLAEGPRILGIVTESDLLRAARDPRYHRRPALGDAGAGGEPDPTAEPRLRRETP